jgi:hypothetical protein
MAKLHQVKKTRSQRSPQPVRITQKNPNFDNPLKKME